MINNDSWFTEAQNGSAFSLRLIEKLHDERTPFQYIEIYKTETFGNLMVIDGCIMLSDRDHFIYHEMITHPALFAHPDPKSVWIIGGGDCGTLSEVVKHTAVETIVQIEIDERVTRLSEQFFPQLCQWNSDPRTTFYFMDGIQWVKEANKDSADIIIVDSTDPVGIAKGLVEPVFYEACWRCLRENGILIQQSESPLFHSEVLQSMQHAMAAAGFSVVNTLFFPQCCYPSGWWCASIAGKNNDLERRKERLKKFETRYYNFQIHDAASAKPEFMRS